jgi:opacity protein-like surface antigen
VRTASIAVLAVALLAAPAAAQAQRAPPPPPSYDYYGPQRDSWYIGFGLGSGNGSYKFQGERVNYLNHHFGASPFQAAFQLEAGATLTSQLLLGGEISGLVSTASSGGIDSTLSVGQVLAVVTFFPTGRGLFLRGGAGFAQISSELDDGFSVIHSEANGVGVLGGVGYAWWLGRRFNLTLHGDANLHAYSGHNDAPSSSATFTGYVGFRWY